MPDLHVSLDPYLALLNDLKARIGGAQVRAVVAVNTELVQLYWQVGTALNEQVRAAGWGAKVLDQLSRDLKLAFPELGGFSPATCAICGSSRRPGLPRNFGNRWLPD